MAEGYDVESATDAPSGLEMAASGSFDAILLDVMLPGKDGFAVVKELRDAGHFVPVLMLTGQDDVTDKVDARNSGVASAGIISNSNTPVT